jgi:hypothetical protein
LVSEVGVCRCESGGNGFLDKFVKNFIGNNFFLKFITSVWKLVSSWAVDTEPSAPRGALLQRTVNRCSNARLPFCGICKSFIDRSAKRMFSSKSVLLGH